MKLVISKSKNSESYYIAQSYKNSDGKSTSKTIRKLGTLKDLKEKLNTDRDRLTERMAKLIRCWYHSMPIVR